LGSFARGPASETPKSPHTHKTFHMQNERSLDLKIGMSVGSESRRRRAESQWIVAARPLCHLQYPVAYLSRLQRILLNDHLKLNFKAAPTKTLPGRGSQVTRAPGGAEATPLLRVKIQSRSDKRRF
jgi:hypothetical protein